MIIEDSFLYATQLYSTGVKEYISSIKNSRDKRGLNMGPQFQEKLEEMLNEPHLKRIKVMKTRLNKADKENERKLHYNLL